MFITLFNFNCSKGKGTSEYNTVIEYEKGKVLNYPDFNLEFIEERTEKKDLPNSGSLTYRFFDFKISNEKESKIINWNYGIGDIAPIDFEFDGNKYQIEMSYTAVLQQRLKLNQIVIVKK